MDVDKFEAKHIIFNPEVPEKSDIYIYIIYLTKCSILKVSGSVE